MLMQVVVLSISDPEPESEKSFSDGAEMVEKPVVHSSSPESDDLPAEADEKKPGNPLGVSVETASPPPEETPPNHEAWAPPSAYPVTSLARRPSSMSRAGTHDDLAPKGPDSPRGRYPGQPEPSPRARYSSTSQPASPRKGGSSGILNVGSKLLSRIKNSKR